MNQLSQPIVSVPASDPHGPGASPPGVAVSSQQPAPLRDDPARVPFASRTVLECGCVLWHADGQLHTDRSACTMKREVAQASALLALAAGLKETFA